MKVYWGSHYERTLLCPPSRLQWSCEHVVPKSVLKNNTVANDPHNLIVLPQRLNSARSSLKYVEGSELLVWKPIYSCAVGTCAAVVKAKAKARPEAQTPVCGGCGKDCSENSNCAGRGRQDVCLASGKVASTGFCPPDLWKGRIARAALYMADTYPYYRSLIDKRVLDLYLAEKWNRESPPQIEDLYWELMVQAVKGKSNLYVTESLTHNPSLFKKATSDLSQKKRRTKH